MAYKCQFYVAAVTDCHKLGGFKQQKCILLQFRRPDICNQSISRVTLLPKALGEEFLEASSGDVDIELPGLYSAEIQAWGNLSGNII